MSFCLQWSTMLKFDQLIYMGVTVYVPALALSAVTPISIEWSIIMTSFVCTSYTAFVSLIKTLRFKTLFYWYFG